MELLCVRCGASAPAGARFCPACATPVGQDSGGATTDEARKLVTVLFADVTGSTALGERLDPERLRAVLQAWYSAASAAIEVWGGTVEKFIGDAIVAGDAVNVAARLEQAADPGSALVGEGTWLGSRGSFHCAERAGRRLGSRLQRAHGRGPG